MVDPFTRCSRWLGETTLWRWSSSACRPRLHICTDSGGGMRWGEEEHDACVRLACSSASSRRPLVRRRRLLLAEGEDGTDMNSWAASVLLPVHREARTTYSTFRCILYGLSSTAPLRGEDGDGIPWWRWRRRWGRRREGREENRGKGEECECGSSAAGNNQPRGEQ